MDENGSWRKNYFVHDHLGSVRSVILDDKSIIGQYDYEPFGAVLWSSDGSNSRLKYIDKETDTESSDHNHGVRQYTDNIGRFLCPDPLWEKYAGWTPYQYSLNNPIRLVDLNGLWPGDPFPSIEAAMCDFGEIFNPYSIKAGKEVAASIYILGTNEKGEDIYSYTFPNIDEEHSGLDYSIASPPPDDKALVAYTHTHGGFKAYMEHYDLDNFSYYPDPNVRSDIMTSRNMNVPMYLFTPFGNFKVYDPSTNQIILIDDWMPSDVRIKERVNTYDANPEDKNSREMRIYYQHRGR